MSQNKITLFTATLVSMNAMIGAGIVTIPRILAKDIGPIGIVSFCITITIIVSIICTLCRLMNLHPGEGWTHRFPSLWGGHIAGKIASTSYIASVTVGMGFLAAEAGRWLSDTLPFDSSTLTAGALILLTILVIAGRELPSLTQYIIAAVVLVAILILCVLCLKNAHTAYLKPFAPYGVNAVARGTPMTLFSLIGFESALSLYSIVKKPEKTVSRAAIIAVLTVGGLYLLFTLAVMMAIPREFLIENGESSLSSILGRLYPQYTYIQWFIYAGTLFAIFGTLHSMLWSMSFLLSDLSSHPQRRCALLLGSLMLVVALFCSSKVIISSSISLMASAYLLSMGAQYRSKIALVGILGGLMMIIFAWI